MLEADELNFLKFVMESGDYITDTKGLKIEIDDVIKSKEHKFYIVSPKSIVTTMTFGFVDYNSSEVIEFLRCANKNNNIEYGRLWAEFKFYDNNDLLISKDKAFEEKYNRYKRWITKNYKISKDKDFYIAQEAYKAYLDGDYSMIAFPSTKVEF